jgi:Homeodomain-like domain
MSMSADAMNTAPIEVRPSDPTATTKLSETHQNVHECSESFIPPKSDETNPPMGAAPRRRLTYTQLAGARLLAQGVRPKQVAKQLRVDPHTVSRWKHDPCFVAEIERVRDELESTPWQPFEAIPSQAPRAANQPKLDLLDPLDDDPEFREIMTMVHRRIDQHK